ncbi:MAG: hypothetical protein WC497_03275 [Patescibacteria group bacterium]
MELKIPPTAYGVTLFVRRGEAHKGVPAISRTLTQEGADHCIRVSSYWEEVIGSLSARFDRPRYFTGPMPAMVLTCYFIFGPSAITVHPHLASTVSGKTVQEGRWFEAQRAAGKTRVQIIRALWEDPTIWEGQPFEHQSRQVHQFLVEEEAGLFRIAVSDEPSITLALLGTVDDDMLGLGPCEGLLIFRDREGTIVGTQKLVPSA